MSNSFGKLFTVTTFGESHGGGVGVVVDGCPPKVAIDLDKVQRFLDRRRPGQSHLSTPRAELDKVECLSGIENGLSLGTPICLFVRNKDAKKGHYSDMTKVFRPSHADFTTQAKFGIRAASGGGRASARETVGRVAGAAIAEQAMAAILPGIEVVAYVDRVKHVSAEVSGPETLSREELDKNPLRSPEGKWLTEMEKVIIDAKKSGDSVGGSITCYVKNVPVGLGAPVFDKLQADLAKACMSLPATRSFEIGLGSEATYLKGSDHNDPFIEKQKDGRRVIGTATNRSGGIQGGISNGEDIYFKIGFKPVATVFKKQETVNEKMEKVEFQPKAGRHDPCVLPRAVPMVEAMASLTIFDHFLRQKVYGLHES